ncbi:MULTISPECIES: hypothetical protein [unclassified Ochrobactrum]|uniref:hypothetical protein n=1 Tax=unclassified Ochrobactrum TaxID=239106 RepID=UPI004045F869
MRALQIENHLVGRLEFQAAPYCPVAAPLAIHLIRIVFRRICALQPERKTVGQIDVATDLGSPRFND